MTHHLVTMSLTWVHEVELFRNHSEEVPPFEKPPLELYCKRLYF